MAGASDSDKVLLERVLEDIHRNWAYVVWPKADRDLDDQAWDKALREEFTGFTVWNLGDGFNYSKCYTYAIVTTPGSYLYPGTRGEGKQLIAQLGGEEHLILLKLSTVAPYFVAKPLCTTVAEGDRFRQTVITEPVGRDRLLLDRSHAFAERHGFTGLNETILQTLVPGAELELAAPGAVTVYNCLFEDEATV